MNPYYQDEFVTIYHGNNLLILPELKEKFDLVVTDPPYSSGGLHKSSRSGDPVKKYLTKKWTISFQGDNKDQRSFFTWLSTIYAMCYELCKPGAYVESFTDWRQFPVMSDVLQAAGFIWRGAIAWDKGRMARLANPRYFRHQCEYILWGTKGKFPAGKTPRKSYDGCFQSRMGGGKSNRFHPTQKPLDLLNHLIEVVPPNANILDPFMGSGPALIAAKQMGRKAIGIEMEEVYCEYAARKLETIHVG